MADISLILLYDFVTLLLYIVDVFLMLFQQNCLVIRLSVKSKQDLLPVGISLYF